MNKHALTLLVALATAGVSLLACAGGASESTRPGGPAAKAWVTTGDQSRLLAPDGSVSGFGTAPPLAANIDVDAATRYQTMAGFGAAITDASAWLITSA
jgi:glucosylceramidase